MSINDAPGRPAFTITIEELLSRYFSGRTPATHTNRAIVGLCIALAPEGTFHAGDKDAFTAHLKALFADYRDRKVDQDMVMRTAIALAASAFDGDRAGMRIGAP